MITLTFTTLSIAKSARIVENKLRKITTTIPLRIVTCNTVDQLKTAMADAKPGDDIIIAPGIYYSATKVKDGIGKFNYFSGLANGTAEHPITLRGADGTKMPILRPSVANEYTSPVIGITGDYWIIKNIEISHGQKGLILDTANHCQLINLNINNIGQEGLHFRSSSSYNLALNCKISHCGVKEPEFGEGVYIGSDQKAHGTYSPDCDRNTIDSCFFGPNVSAECIDVKEGTQNTVIKNCTFDATGISGANSADAFIDLKGGYSYVYNNTFNANNATILASCIDFQERTGTNSGYRNAIFNNIFNLGESKKEIPTARKRGGEPSEIHVWGNTRNPVSPDFPEDGSGTLRYITQSCPTWNILPCSGLANVKPTVQITTPTNETTINFGTNITITATAIDSDGTITKVAFYNGNTKLSEITSAPYQYTYTNPAIGSYNLTAIATDNDGVSTTSSEVKITVQSSSTSTIPNNNTDPSNSECNFNTPSNNPLESFEKIEYSKMHVLGNLTNAPNTTNFKKITFEWSLTNNNLKTFAYSTNNGIPSYYIDLRSQVIHNFKNTQPDIIITNSGISNFDGEYWVNKVNSDLVLVSKTKDFTLYFSNDIDKPDCNSNLTLSDKNQSINFYQEKNDVLSIYPNPAKNSINFKDLHKINLIKIFNISGQLIEEISNQIETKDISNLKEGIYVININDKRGVKNIKLIIKK